VPTESRTPSPPEQRSRIADYGVIGDCRSAALVSRYGSLDWLCWPRFDSPAIFAALLDGERGGAWRIAPAGASHAEHRYLGESNLLETRFHQDAAEARLLDLMPVASEEFKNQNLVPDHELVRQLECMRGEMEFAVHFEPRAGYGLAAVFIKQKRGLGLRVDVGSGAYWLRSSVPFAIEGGRASARFRLHAGERAQFSLSYAEESPMVLPLLGDAMQGAIERTQAWWQQWSAQCTYRGPYREAVIRSALALKLLTYAPSGAMTAAATTSLPEIPGDRLNWDYRYCWLRDASLTMRALLGLGYRAEAESFLGWLLHATRHTQPELRPLYTVFGRDVPREKELPHLRGFAESRPVRKGNGARDQLQLDIFGELAEAAAHFAGDGGELDGVTQKALLGLGKYVAANWDQPDDGIWEPRNRRRDHTYSRLLAWTALDRMLKLHQQGKMKRAPVERFSAEREKIARQIRQRAWNPKLNSYVSELDGDQLDATLLRIAWYEFESEDSERMRGTYQAVCRELSAGDGLLYRYRREPAEGAFGICGFWAVEYLAQGGGTLAEAHRAFQRLLIHANDLGLYAEETDAATGDALGNFPQSFTHVGLISAALSLEERALEERKHGEREQSQRQQSEQNP
jgi:GH15 family glucan-1,4-alpha-glucosidase